MNSAEKPPGIWQVISSVLAAMFGVQSAKARERDFTRGRPAAYIIGGLVFVILFVILLYFVVQMVVPANQS